MASSIEGRPPLAVIFMDIEGVFLNETSPRSQKELAEHKINILKDYPVYLDPNLENRSHLLELRAKARCLNASALKNLGYLIENLEKSMQVAIVITSLWRDQISAVELREHVFKDLFFHGHIIDKIADSYPSTVMKKHFSHNPLQKTPSELCLEKYGFDLIHHKGRLIDYWLRENCELLNIYSFVIIDSKSGDYYSTEINARFPDRFCQIKSNNLLTFVNAFHCFEILQTPFNRIFPKNEDIEAARELAEKRLQERLEKYIQPLCPPSSFPRKKA